MTEFWLYSLIIFMAIVAFLVLLVSVVAIYFFISSCFMRYPPPIPSSGRLKEKVLEGIREYLQTSESMVFMDLGSGWGTLLIPLAKQFPQHRFVGVERVFMPYFFSKLRAHKLKNLSFIHGDIFKTDISQTDLVFCFLMQKLMNDLTPLLKKNLKSGARVCSCRFTCPDWEPEKTVSLGTDYETYYIYRKD